MNRIVIATLLALSSLIICVTEVLNTNFISEKITTDLYSLQQLVSDENIEDAKKLSNDIFDFWENNTVILAIFTQHESLETIEETLSLMSVALEQDDISNFWSENLSAIVQISNLKDTEYPTIQNIL